MLAAAFLFVVIFFLTGIPFGFLFNPYAPSLGIFLSFIIPTAVAVVSSELIRSYVLSAEYKWSKHILLVALAILEVILYEGFGYGMNFSRFMDIIALTLFPAFTGNILYHYVSERYGAIPNILYRLITSLYIYLFNSVSAVPDVLLVVIKLVYPLIFLFFIRLLYEKQRKTAKKKTGPLYYTATTLVAVLLIGFVMLVSCQFKFGLLVIGSESMTGSINKGDCVIYERYDGKEIKEDTVIVFTKFDTVTIHRVVDIEYINNETRYYTKGDANESIDIGYITSADIIGTVDLKVPYVGYPTILLRGLFE
jgi:signal peptidase I